jgi:hypothetical protein
VVEHLLCEHKTLSSNPNAAKTNNNNKNTRHAIPIQLNSFIPEEKNIKNLDTKVYSSFQICVNPNWKQSIDR